MCAPRLFFWWDCDLGPPPRGGSGSISEVAWNQNIFFKQNIENNQWNQFFLTENIWNSEVGSGADCWLANLQSCPFQRRWLENDSGALPLAQGLAKEMAFAGWQVMQWFRFCNLLRSFFYMTGLVCRGHSFWHDCLAEEKGNENLAGLELPFFFNKHEKQHFFSAATETETLNPKPWGEKNGQHFVYIDMLFFVLKYVVAMDVGHQFSRDFLGYPLKSGWGSGHQKFQTWFHARSWDHRWKQWSSHRCPGKA